MTEGGKLISVLLALLILGICLIAHGLGWATRLSFLGVGFTVTWVSVALLAAMLRR
jgi:hypothetical protein